MEVMIKIKSFLLKTKDDVKWNIQTKHINIHANAVKCRDDSELHFKGQINYNYIWKTNSDVGFRTALVKIGVGVKIKGTISFISIL